MNNTYSTKPIRTTKSGKPIFGDDFTNWRGAIKRKFGITPETYYQLSESQSHLCAICNGIDDRGAKLAVDHCHNTGKIRGLLCRKCNVALGYLNDDIVLLESALNYLKSHKNSP